MSWGAVAGAAIGVVGGAISANAARKAGNSQAAAARDAAEMNLQAGRESNELQAAALRQQLLTSAPSYYGGNVALSALMGGMGLGSLKSPSTILSSATPRSSTQAPAPGNVGVPATGTPSTGNIPGDIRVRPMSTTSGTSGTTLTNLGGYQVPTIGVANMPRNEGDAGDTPTYTDADGNLVDAEGNLITAARDNTYGIGNIYYGPDQNALDSAANQYGNMFTEQFTGQDIYSDPSYQFRLSEGEKLLRARQAASGNRFSGQAMKDITNYGQEAASQEYGNAYNRFMQTKSVLYDRLANLAGIGTGAGNAMNAATSNAATNIGNTTVLTANNAAGYLTSGAAAQAAGQVGSTNALVGGINTGLNNWYTMRYLQGKSGE